MFVLPCCDQSHFCQEWESADYVIINTLSPLPRSAEVKLRLVMFKNTVLSFLLLSL